MRAWILNRFKERSTWIGIVTVACSVGGFSLTDVQQQAVVTAGVAVIGLILAFTKDAAVQNVQIGGVNIEPQPASPGVVVVTEHPKTVRMPDGSVRPVQHLAGGDSPADDSENP